jgi:hypothetical protein
MNPDFVPYNGTKLIDERSPDEVMWVTSTSVHSGSIFVEAVELNVVKEVFRKTLFNYTAHSPYLRMMSVDDLIRLDADNFDEMMDEALAHYGH